MCHLNALGPPLSGPDNMSVTSWFLVSSSGSRHRLPKEMIFVGREDCELMLQSRSVDKQHAVINYNATTDEHLVKDLGSLNGTFVNDLRIPDQTYMTLKVSDIIRFGYDSHVYLLEKSQHKVPEEALKHEKYTSQLQMSLKRAELEEDTKVEKNPTTKSLTQEAPAPRPTPLYGQPSWWGEEDYGSPSESRDEPHPGKVLEPSRTVSSAEILTLWSEMQKESSSVDFPGSLSDPQSKTLIPSYQREASYFEIPTKDLQLPKAVEAELQEIPTKDTDTPPAPPPSETPPVVQSHASFTIEFDDCSPGKIKIKDHVTKFSSRQRKNLPPTKMRPTTATPADVMSSESKVADWLVHSDVSMMRRRPTCDDVYSTKSDLAMNIKMLKGHHHDDGTQSDSEDPVLKGRRSKSQHSVDSRYCVQLEASPAPPMMLEQPLCPSPPQPRSPATDPPKPPEHLSQQAFIIEFFDDNPRKKRSQSFTHNPAHTDSYSTLKAKLERRKGGERPASVHGHVPPTQQASAPFKGHAHAGPQRSSSLKREKGETESASSSSTSRCTSAIFVRPFGSVGKKSTLAQEFAVELLKDACQQDSYLAGDIISPPPMSAPPVMVTPPLPPSPKEPSATAKVANVAHPALPPAFMKASLASDSLNRIGPPRPSSGSVLLPLGGPGGDPKGYQRSSRNEEDDSVSEAGTYTIDTDGQDQEVEEARNMIDQVFGVLDSPEYAGLTPGTFRPVIDEDQDEHANIASHASAAEMLHDLSAPPMCPLQVPPAGLEGPKWVSRWASLADGYVQPASTPPQSQEDLQTLSQQVEGCSLENLESSESNRGSRTRRRLPQVPPEKLDGAIPNLLIRRDGDHMDRGPQGNLSVQDEVDPDSLSDASRSEDAPVSKQTNKDQARFSSCTGQEKLSSSTKSTIFYIGSGEIPTKPDPARFPVQFERPPDPHMKSPPTTILIRHLSSHEGQRGGIKPNSSAPNLQTQDKDCVPTKELLSLVRQESFTKDGPTDNVCIKKLPHISSHPSIRDMEQRKFTDMESFLQETKSPGSGQSSKKGGSSSHMDDSLSGESDVDTASTVSQVSSKNASASSALKKRPKTNDQKQTTSSSQEKGRKLTARERLSEKRRNQTAVNATNKAEAAKRLQMRRSSGNRGSLDLSESQQASDQEIQTPSRSKKLIYPLQKEDIGKMSKTGNVQVLTRSNSLSAPRPTRASMLRRARLGEASDNEGAETDRASQSSDHVAAAPKTSQEVKKLSRLDILALPRKRTGSFTAPSSNETSSTSRSGFSGRSTDVTLTTRKSSAGDTRQTASKVGVPGKNSSNRSSGTKYPNSGVHSNFSSSSEEDYKSSGTSLKTKRPTQTPRTSRTATGRSKSVSLETEEDEDRSDPYQNWSTHSAEIAKLSHDLAKDLAILAKEIHDVAGDGDPNGASGDMTPASPGSRPDTSAMSAREELVQLIPEAALNFQKVPTGSAPVPELDANMNEATQSLSPLSQLSHAIRDNTEQLAAKIKVVFHNKADVLEEMDKKMDADKEVPVLKGSNQEITSIVTELRRVQRQLEVINWVVDPAGSLQSLSQSPRMSSKEKKAASKQNGVSQKATRHMP
ncbi:centrosomal protein of 170 kDa protein B [Dunckerocampus dactyliophorus]|uniref:centrosomal protein of 170 kDa protein B n=1 Tax=Dunckerocampus dactyliophorus TaxID=161453 RepID=UPI002405B44F|nr:centrosomal protein of 170 kDa protein B [Dunckerocampus dactyliophorus]